MSEFRRGVRLGVDVGRARIGVARCDPDGLLATPVETVPRSDGSIARLRELIAEYEPLEVLVGLPLSLSGGDTPSTADAREFAAALKADIEGWAKLVRGLLSAAAPSWARTAERIEALRAAAEHDLAPAA